MKKIIKRYQVEIFILLGFVILLMSLPLFYPPVRVGDGSNYYAIYTAFKTNLKPYMTPDSWRAYRVLAESNQVENLLDAGYLRKIRTPLTVGGTTDFSHFWMYSLLAFVVGLPFNMLGVPIGAHTAFLLLHAFLLSLTWIVAYRLYAWRGLAAVALLTFLSPIVWFFDKVHTELFTFCLTTTAVIYFMRRRYLPSAFFLALAAAQNISFAAISGLVLLIDFFDRKGKAYSLETVLLLFLSLVLNLINPLYSLLRHGVLSPQQVHGYIQLGSHLSQVYIWFFDPDIGLFPHWPFGFLLFVSALVLAWRYRQRWKRHYRIILFVGVYLAASLAAQSSTVNINAGGNPGVSRYALWYLALFFPLILYWVSQPLVKRWRLALVSALILLAAWYNLAYYHPGIDQFNYVRPSAFSFWFQKNLPAFYNPPVEIFSERYGGVGENILNKGYLAVLGPDCRKLLLIYENGGIVLGGETCNFDRSRLSRLVRQKALRVGPQELPLYISLSEAEFDLTRNASQMGTWFEFNHASPETTWLHKGWSYPESWGVWMGANKARMRVLCPAEPERPSEYTVLQVDVVSFVAPDDQPVEARIYIDQNYSWSGKLKQDRRVNVPYTRTVCQKDGFFDLHFEVSRLFSPQKFGLSDDDRQLGIGLVRLRFISNPTKDT